MDIKKETFQKMGNNIMRGFLLVFFLLNFQFSHAQWGKSTNSYHIPKQRKNSIFCCYNNVLNKFKKNNYKAIQKFKSNRQHLIYIKNDNLTIRNNSIFSLRLKSSTDRMSEWTENVSENQIRYSFVNYKQNNILIITAPIAGASGLATNFYKYLIINLKNGSFHIVQSLSNDCKFFYVSSNILKFDLFDYSQIFLTKRDYDNISLDINHYQFDGIKLTAMSTTTTKCDCK